MTEIAECYLHLKVKLDPHLSFRAKNYLYEISKPLADDLFKQDASVEIEIEDGSWKTWVIVMGVLYEFVSQYGSLREGIDYLIKDARRFSEIVSSRFVSENAIPPDAVFRMERRLGVPGRIQRLIKRLDRLRRREETHVGHDLEREIHAIELEVLELLEKIGDATDKRLFLKSLSGLPPQISGEGMTIYVDATPHDEQEQTLWTAQSEPRRDVPLPQSKRELVHVPDEAVLRDEEEERRRLLEGQRIRIRTIY